MRSLSSIVILRTINIMTNIEHVYQLDECLDWIISNGFKRVAMQLKLEDLKYSARITSALQERFHQRSCQTSATASCTGADSLDLYVAQSSTCCVDLLVTQHVSNLDAVIHIGKVCLSKPEINNQQIQLPVLFAFGHPPITQAQLSENTGIIIREIESLVKSSPQCQICLLYDTSLVDYVHELSDAIQKKGYEDFVDIANLYCPSEFWHTTPKNMTKFVKQRNDDEHQYGQYLLKNSMNHYNCAIYLGNRPSIQLALEGPSKLIRIECYNNKMDIENVNVSRLLNRRMALVGRLKEEQELKVGVIITNPLPEIGSTIERLESYAKPRKHTLYFISMIQTIDECKIGNFDLCDAFIVINSCTCSTILESLVFNRPIITELEFKLACGFEAEYGRVLWPGSSSHLSEDDMINKRKVSDVSVALIHMRNELLERCSQARANKWSGMNYKASDDDGGGVDGVAKESLVVEEGLRGIASSYVSEPLERAELKSAEKDASGGGGGDSTGAGGGGAVADLAVQTGIDND